MAPNEENTPRGVSASRSESMASNEVNNTPPAPKRATSDQTTSNGASSDTPSVAHIIATEASAVLAAAAKLIGTDDPKLSAYFDDFMRSAIPEDIIRFSDAELAALVNYVYAKSAARNPGVPLIETFDPSEIGFARSQTVLVAINDDMPFLYDSCANEVRERGFRIRAAFHPIMSRMHKNQDTRITAKISESTIVFALEKISDQQALEALRQGVNQVFTDVRLAVADWKPMLTRLRDTIGELKQSPPDIPAERLDEYLAFLGWLADNHFTFLGARDYVFNGAAEGRHDPDFDSGIGLLTNQEMRVIRRGEDRSSLTPDVRDRNGTGRGKILGGIERVRACSGPGVFRRGRRGRHAYHRKIGACCRADPEIGG